MNELLDITDYFLDIGCFDPEVSEGWTGRLPVPVDSTVTKIQGCISDKTGVGESGTFVTDTNFVVQVEGPEFGTPVTIGTATWQDSDDNLEFVLDIDIDQYVWIPAGNIVAIIADDTGNPPSPYAFWFNFTVTFSRKCR